jgi:hypothetical protein
MTPPVIAARRKLITCLNGMLTGPSATPQTTDAASTATSSTTSGRRLVLVTRTEVTGRLSGKVA